MLIVDAHEDIAFNALAMQRDFTESVATTRAREGAQAENIATLGLPEQLAGGVGIVFGTLFVLPADTMALAQSLVYRTAEEASQQAQQQLAIYRRLAEHPQITLIQTRADLAGVLAGWDRAAPQLGIVVLMEGADPIRAPAEAADWYADGVRLVGPAWASGSRYCNGNDAPGPLSGDGRSLMREMSRARLTLDLSHMADASFWEALDLFDGTVIASHANCRALVPGPNENRHLSNAMIKGLVERDGVIGVVLYNRFLDSSWTPKRGKDAVGLDLVVRHIDHICQLAGDARHVAIGSDFDGGFGSEAIPRELDTVADLPRLADALRRHGFAEDDVAAVMGRNWLRKLETLLP
jgi:membrane dipeptidase